MQKVLLTATMFASIIFRGCEMPFYAVCPYFQYEKKKLIGCEFKNMSFPTYDDKAIWMSNLCCTFDYENCANAQKLNRKYARMYGEK